MLTLQDGTRSLLCVTRCDHLPPLTIQSESEAQIKADQHGPSGKPSKKLQEQTIESE
jgi:hypothetical protein